MGGAAGKNRLFGNSSGPGANPAVAGNGYITYLRLSFFPWEMGTLAAVPLGRAKPPAGCPC